MQPVPLELRLCPPQLLIGRPVTEQLVDQVRHLLLKLLWAHPVAGAGIAEAERVAADQAHSRGARTLGVLGAADQLLVQPRSLAMPKDAERQVQRVEILAAARRQPP